MGPGFLREWTGPRRVAREQFSRDSNLKIRSIHLILLPNARNKRKGTKSGGSNHCTQPFSETELN
jgi:hypothetical protein